MFNIILTMLVILLMPFHSANASNENYDDVKIGNISNYKIESGKYSIDFHEGEDAPESWTFSGSINSDFNKQLKKVMQYLSLNKPNSDIVAIKFNMNTRERTQIFISRVLQIFMNFLAVSFRVGNTA